MTIITLFAWMLLPFAVVAGGLYGLQDYRLTVYLYGGTCCLLPVLIHRPRLRFWPLNLSPLLLGGLMLLALVGMLWLWERLSPLLMSWPDFAGNLLAIKLTPERFFWGDALYFVIMNPLLEEIFWRGLVYRQLQERWSGPQALVVSSVMFGAWHWVVIQHSFGPLWAVPLALLIMLGGVNFALLYRKTGTLAAPILLHASMDLAIIGMLHQAMPI